MALTLPKSYAQDVTQPIKVRNGGELVFTGNSDVDTISVALYNGGAEYEPGGSVTLNCIRADGVTMVVSGAVSGNVASATLTQACCAVPGMMTVVMQLTSGGTGAIFAAVYNVLPSSTDTVGDAGTIIEDVAALVADIEAATASVPPVATALMAAIATTFSASTAYAAGQYVWYNGTLYQFTADHAAGAWVGTDATAAVVGEDVSELKSAVGQIEDEVFVYDTEKEVATTANTWRLNESDGLCSKNNDYKLIKYAVTAGEMLKVVSDDRFQFQSAASVPSSGTSNRVGVTYGSGVFNLRAPENATYLIISTVISGSTANVYVAGSALDALKEELDKTAEELEGNIEQGLVNLSATGNTIILKNSATANLISLVADTNCTVVICGKNLLSADFEKKAYADRTDECVIIGKGGYDYCFSARVTVAKCEDNTIALTPTSSNVVTTGVGIFIKVKPSTKYALSYQVSGPGTASISAYGSDKAYISSVKESAQSGYSWTTGDTTEYVCVAFRGTENGTQATFTDMQLEEGATATGYAAHQAKQTVSLTAGVLADVSGIYSYFPETHITASNGATINVEYYANPKSYIDGQFDEIISDIQKNMFVSSYNTLDGWEAHAKAFSQLMYDVGDAEGFMFFTDTHFMAKQTESEWKEYAYAIFAYMEQLYYASPCSFVLHGGDWLGSGESWDNIIYKLSTLGGIFRSKFNRFALLVGNHETGNQSDGHHITTHGTLAATLLSNVGRTYYRFDANTFHMYCFDSWVSGAEDSYAKEQIAWFGKCLEVETAEHIAIAIHILYDSEVLKYIGDELTKMADAYNNGQADYEYDGDTYDFSGHTGNVAFVIAGHRHLDETGTVNNIPYIMTLNTTEYSDTSFDNLPLPVDLIKVDWILGKLTAYRAARGATGTTREISIIV